MTSKQDWASHEQGFVAIASQVFSSSRDGARQAFLKLCSWIDHDPQTGAMLAGQSNTPQTYDQVYERTHQRVLTWDLEAIFRQVALPDEFLDAGALPTLHDRYGISTNAMTDSIKGWL